MATRFLLLLAVAAALAAGGCSSVSTRPASDRSAARVASVNAPRPVQSHYHVSVTPVADDLLETGSVTVRRNGRVGVSLQVEYSTCSYPVTYSAAFCPANGGACTALGDLPVMGGGAAQAVFSFSDPGVHAGVFNFTCGGIVKLSTGVYKPGRADYRYDVGLEPAATVDGGLGSAFVPGNDRLHAGSVSISFAAPGTPDLDVALRAAVPDSVYSVRFCPAGAGALSACPALGSLATGARGDGTASITLPPGSYVGVFILTRTTGATESVQFVTAFRINGSRK